MLCFCCCCLGTWGTQGLFQSQILLLTTQLLFCSSELCVSPQTAFVLDTFTHFYSRKQTEPLPPPSAPSPLTAHSSIRRCSSATTFTHTTSPERTCCWLCSTCVCVCVCTWDGGVVAVLLAVAVLLPVSVLLRVQQTQFVTNLEGLADRPHDAHGLTLDRKTETETQSENNLYHVFSLYKVWVSVGGKFLFFSLFLLQPSLYSKQSRKVKLHFPGTFSLLNGFPLVSDADWPQMGLRVVCVCFASNRHNRRFTCGSLSQFSVTWTNFCLCSPSKTLDMSRSLSLTWGASTRTCQIISQRQVRWSPPSSGSSWPRGAEAEQISFQGTEAWPANTTHPQLDEQDRCSSSWKPGENQDSNRQSPFSSIRTFSDLRTHMNN